MDCLEVYLVQPFILQLAKLRDRGERSFIQGCLVGQFRAVAVDLPSSCFSPSRKRGGVGPRAVRAITGAAAVAPWPQLLTVSLG